MSIILEQAKRLPVPERMKLAQEIWDSIESEPETVELSPEQRAELERRIEDFRRDPSGGIPWETIRNEALARNPR
jgi:putative addiction module component (TIGR02574 family)